MCKSQQGSFRKGRRRESRSGLPHRCRHREKSAPAHPRVHQPRRRTPPRVSADSGAASRRPTRNSRWHYMHIVCTRPEVAQYFMQAVFLRSHPRPCCVTLSKYCPTFRRVPTPFLLLLRLERGRCRAREVEAEDAAAVETYEKGFWRLQGEGDEVGVRRFAADAGPALSVVC